MRDQNQLHFREKTAGRESLALHQPNAPPPILAELYQRSPDNRRKIDRYSGIAVAGARMYTKSDTWGLYTHVHEG